MMTHCHTLEPSLDTEDLFPGSYILYNLHYLKWDIGFLLLLPVSLCECVCLETNDFFFPLTQMGVNPCHPIKSVPVPPNSTEPS